MKKQTADIIRPFQIAGFTLIEIAIVMVIVGIVISIVSTVMPSLIRSSRIKKGQATLERADNALQGYLVANYRLPCPDTNGDGIADPVDGTDCDNYVGDLPYLTLTLSDGNDAWENPILYAVYGAVGDDQIDLTNAYTDANDFCNNGLVKASNEMTQGDDGDPEATDDNGFISTKLYTMFTDASGVPDNGSRSGQAYVLISGGPSDLDNPAGFFDDLNGKSNLEFDAPRKMQTTTYDDLVRAVSINTILGTHCSAGGGGTPGGGGYGSEDCKDVESAYCGNCADTIDNDDDGKTDCDDPDCVAYPACDPDAECGIGGSGSWPSGTVNSDLASITLTTTGNCEGTTEWTLVDNAGFTDFYLHPYTGALSGKLDQCPGTYEIKVKVTDLADPPHAPEKTFSIEVESNLEVIRDGHNPSPDIDWIDSDQVVTFAVNGGYIGNITWELVDDPDDTRDDVFTMTPNGETCEFKKNGLVESAIWPAKFTFRLSAKDDACPEDNQAELIFTVSVYESAAGSGFAEGLLAHWQFDECRWTGTTGEVKDNSENGENHATIKNNAFTLGNGKICRAASTDKPNAYLLLNPEIQLGAEWTIATWFVWPLASSGSGWWTLTRGSNDHQILVNRSSKRLGTYDNQGGTAFHDSGFTMSDLSNGWHHLVAVGHGAQTDFYIDGVLKGTADYKSETDIRTIGNYIGGSQNWGIFDEMMIWDRALEAVDIPNLMSISRSTCMDPQDSNCYSEPIAEYRMDEPSWSTDPADDPDIFDSKGDKNGKSAGGALPNSQGKVCWAGEFDGSNDYVTLGDNFNDVIGRGNNAFTVTAWISPSTPLNAHKTNHLTQNTYFAKASVPRNDNLEIGVNTNRGIHVYLDTRNKDTYADFGNGAVILDQFNFVAVTYDSGFISVMINDKEYVDTATWLGAIEIDSATGSPVTLGASIHVYDYFTGLLDEIRLYDRGLSLNELADVKAVDSDRTCVDAGQVTIMTDTLPSAVMGASYPSSPPLIIDARFGTKPYGWAIEATDAELTGKLTINALTGELSSVDNLNICAGEYSITIKVEDDNKNTDQKIYTITITNGTLALNPGVKTLNCTTSDFERDFFVTGPLNGGLNWNLIWQPAGNDPGGFSLVSTGNANARLMKTGGSTPGNFAFKVQVTDSLCPDNTSTFSGYGLSISGSCADVPYYEGRVADWWMDETAGVQVEDHSGNSNHGTPSGSGIVTKVQGRVWYAFDFDGVNGNVNCGNDLSLDVSGAGTDFTIAAWVKPQGAGYFLDKGTGSLADGYGLSIEVDKFAFNTVGDEGVGGKDTIIGDNSVSAGTWYHVVGTRNSGNKKLYVNAVLQANTSTDSRNLSDPSRNFFIGKADILSGGYFKGSIDEVTIYQKALSQSDIEALYNQASLVLHFKMDETSGDIYDYSGQNNHGSNTGVIYGATGKIGYALEFDGNASHYIDCGDKSSLSKLSGLTMAAWVHPVTGIASNDIVLNKEYEYALAWASTNQVVVAIQTDTSTWQWECASGNDTVMLDEWTHVVYTWDGVNIKCYINGAFKTSSAQPGNTTKNSNSPSTLRIGARTCCGGAPWNGYIDDVRIYNRPLLGSEVLNLYNKGVDESARR